MPQRLLALAALLALAGCGAFGNVTTATMQGTNAVAGAPPNGAPGVPPPPRAPAL